MSNRSRQPCGTTFTILFVLSTIPFFIADGFKSNRRWWPSETLRSRSLAHGWTDGRQWLSDRGHRHIFVSRDTDVILFELTNVRIRRALARKWEEEKTKQIEIGKWGRPTGNKSCKVPTLVFKDPLFFFPFSSLDRRRFLSFLFVKKAPVLSR